MIFDEIVQLEKLEINQGDLETEFNQTMMSLASQGYDFNKVKGGNRAQKEIANNVAQQSATQLITRMTLDRLKDIATGDFVKAEKAAAKAEKEKAAEEAKAAKEASEPKEEKMEETDVVEVESVDEKPEETKEEAGE